MQLCTWKSVHRKIRIISKDSSDLSWYDGIYGPLCRFCTIFYFPWIHRLWKWHHQPWTQHYNKVILSLPQQLEWYRQRHDNSKGICIKQIPGAANLSSGFFSRFLYCKDKCRSVPLQKRDSDWYRSAVRFPDEDNENMDLEKIYQKDVLCFRWDLWSDVRYIQQKVQRKTSQLLTHDR